MPNIKRTYKILMKKYISIKLYDKIFIFKYNFNRHGNRIKISDSKFSKMNRIKLINSIYTRITANNNRISIFNTNKN